MASVTLSLLIGTFAVALVLFIISWPLFSWLRDLVRHKGPWIVVPWNRHYHTIEDDDCFQFEALSGSAINVLVFDPVGEYRGRPMRLAGAIDAHAIYVIPIRYSNVDAGFVVSAQVGESILDLVLDSGSANVSVASAECVASNQCGPNATAGYDPNLSSTSIDLRSEDTLNYASLEVKAKKFMDTIHFFASADGLDDLCERRHWSKNRPTTRMQLTDTLVASASSMDGTHSNILGLMQGSGFLDHMFGQTGMRPQWGIVCHQKSPWFVIGSIEDIPCVPKKNILWLPLSTRFRYMGAYVLDLTGIRVNGESIVDGPQFVIVDTGTAESYWSPAACRGRWNPDEIERGSAPTIEFDFKTMDNLGWRMTWTRDHYMEGSRSTLHGDNPNIGRLFPSERVMILGIAHMMGLYWHFDLEKRRVGVCPWA